MWVKYIIYMLIFKGDCHAINISIATDVETLFLKKIKLLFIHYT